MNHAIIAARLPGPEPDKIIAAVCAHLELQKEDILNCRTRKATAMYARHLSIYIARRHGKHKQIVLASYFKRNRKAIVESERIVRGWIDIADPRTISDLSTIISALVQY